MRRTGPLLFRVSSVTFRGHSERTTSTGSVLAAQRHLQNVLRTVANQQRELVVLRLCLSSDGESIFQVRRRNTPEWVSLGVHVPGHSDEDGGERIQHALTQELSCAVESFIRAEGSSLQMTPASVIAERPLRGCITSAARFPSSSHSSRRTILDFTVNNYDYATQLRKYIENRFPRLRLVIDHSSSNDLQNMQTHAISVSLVSRVPSSSGGYDEDEQNPTWPLSSEEENMVKSFAGEAVGETYTSALRRALQEAFTTVEIPPPTPETMWHSEVSLLSLFKSKLCQELGVSSVDCVMTAADTSTGSGGVMVELLKGRECIKSAHASESDALSVLLSLLESALQDASPEAYDSLRNHCDASSLVLVLPDTNLRTKLIVSRLLGYYYGLKDTDIAYNFEREDLKGDRVPGGLWRCTLCVDLPSSIVSAPPNSHPQVLRLCSLAAPTKRMAKQMVRVAFLKRHFPRIFEEQLSFHPTIQAHLQLCGNVISESDPSDSDRSFPVRHSTAMQLGKPNLSNGIEARFAWEMRRLRLQWSIETTRDPVALPISSPHQRSIRAPQQPSVWHATLTYHDVTPCAGGSAENVPLDNPASSTITSQKQVVCCASKKHHSEQKAMCAALVELLPAADVADVIHLAVKAGWMNADGSLLAEEGLWTDEQGDSVNDNLDEISVAVRGLRQRLDTQWSTLPETPVGDVVTYPLCNANIDSLLQRLRKSSEERRDVLSPSPIDPKSDHSELLRLLTTHNAAVSAPGSNTSSSSSSDASDLLHSSIGEVPALDVSLYESSPFCVACVCLERLYGYPLWWAIRSVPTSSHELVEPESSCSALPVESPPPEDNPKPNTDVPTRLPAPTLTYTVSLFTSSSDKTEGEAGALVAAVGDGPTARDALRNCGRAAFRHLVNDVVRVLPSHRPMNRLPNGATQQDSRLVLRLLPMSLLGKLITSVVSDIQRSSDLQDVEGAVHLHCTHRKSSTKSHSSASFPPVFTAAAVCTAQQGSVTIEEVTCRDAISALTKLLFTLNTEMKTVDLRELKQRMRGLPHQQLLQFFCFDVLGLQMRCESAYVEGLWHSSVYIDNVEGSVPNWTYLLGCSCASSKIDAVRGAHTFAHERYVVSFIESL